MIKAILNRYKKFLLYSLFGGIGVTTDFSAYSFLVMIGVYYQFANIIGYSAGTIVSFILNRYYTFRVLDSVFKRFASFISIALIGYTVSSIMLFLFVEIVGIDKIISKIMTLFVVLLLQFTLNKTITFKENK